MSGLPSRWSPGINDHAFFSKHVTGGDKLHGNQEAVAGTFFTDGGNRSAPQALNHTLNKLTHSIK